MNLSVRPTGAWQHALDIEVPLDEVERRLEEVARQIQRRAALPGFRKGRVPLDMVRQHFAASVEQEFLESYLPRVTGEAVDEARLNPVVPPLVRNLRFAPGQSLRFEAVVDVRPEIEAKDYKGLPVSRHSRPVDEAAVERVLAGLLEDTAVFLDVDRPAGPGDVVLLDSTRLDANGRRLSGTRAKARRVQLGGEGVPPDLETGLLGAEAGQERTLTVNYPEDYPAPEVAGKAARYVVKIRKIQEKKLRALDDNLAKEVFKLDSLEELRSRVRLNLEGEERVRVQREGEAALTEALLERNTFELPQRLVEYMLERVIREATGGREVPEALRKDLETRYKANVERSLRREVLLAAVARQERLEVSDDEVSEEIQRMADADPRQAARIRARYLAAEARSGLRESLLERKALDWLMNAAEVREESSAEPLIIPATR
ncbi:MAG TPA: trigger factor [Candidatus Saccharimonadaceae bacterium]|jgi:trigger factor|nr:trigger factor [Candidatus Saccharimonadaceae bacterium]